MDRRIFIHRSGALAAAAVAGQAFAQSPGGFPSKSIRLILPVAAGGSMDAIARAVIDGATPALGQPILVDNRGGAAGFMAAESVAKSPADGHSRLLGK